MSFTNKRRAIPKLIVSLILLLTLLNISGCAVSDLVSNEALITPQNSASSLPSDVFLYDKEENIISNDFFFKKRGHIFEWVGPGGVAKNAGFNHALYEMKNDESNGKKIGKHRVYIVQTKFMPQNKKTRYHYSFILATKDKVVTHILPDKYLREQIHKIARNVGLQVAKNNEIELKNLKGLLKFTKEFFSTYPDLNLIKHKSVSVMNFRTDTKQLIKEIKNEGGEFGKALCNITNFKSTCLIKGDEKKYVQLLATLGDEKAMLRYTLHELYEAVESNKYSKIHKVAKFIQAINQKFNNKDLQYISETYLEEREDVSTRVSKISLNRFKSAYAFLKGNLKMSENVDIFKTAREWLPKAHEKGSKEASHLLGHILKESDPVKAANWFLEGDKLGNPYSQIDVANMFYVGKLIKKDEEAAIRIMRRAASQGEALAQFRLGEFLQMKNRSTAEQKEANEWLSKALKQYQEVSGSSLFAESRVAFMYKSGYGVKQDYKESASRYKKLAKKGYPWAHYHLALQYIEGDGIEVDYDKAKKHLKMASYKGVKAADNIMKRLGW